MSLKCGIIGLTKVGKTTLFNCMSNVKAKTDAFDLSSNKANVSIINVPDPRLKELSEIQPTEKIVPATVEIVDIPGLTKSNKGDNTTNKFLSEIRNTDALIHVLRCFDDPLIPHIENTIDPVRDIETIDFELQVKDLESIEKKLEKLYKISKSGDKNAQKSIPIFEKAKQELENFKNLRDVAFTDEEKTILNELFLLTLKPVMYVCNIDQDSLHSSNKYVESVKNYLENKKTEVLIIAGKLEEEIAELENEDDRNAFLSDAGLTEPGVNKLIRAAYKLLDLISFFTVGPKEIRAWTIKRGMNAQQAAGVIHSDLEKGFIRAEVMKYEDFIKYRSETKIKEAGKLRLEGKTYIVEDGDILHIRFNV